MSDNSPNIDALIRRFKRLALADLAFHQCQVFAEHMLLEHDDPQSFSYTPQMAGLVVTYAKNFVEADGIGPLREPFVSFSDSVMDDTHKKLIQSRHKIYAHRDVQSAPSFHYEGTQAEPYHVRVEVKAGESSLNILSAVPDLLPEFLPFAIRLCEIQREKVKVELGNILPILTKGRSYKPGIYTVGNGFP